MCKGKKRMFSASQAKELTLALWDELAEHGYEFKRCTSVWDKVKELPAHCPLCQYAGDLVRDKPDVRDCDVCILGRKVGGCNRAGTPYQRWVWTLPTFIGVEKAKRPEVIAIRKRAAQEIADTVRKWRVK